MLEFCEYLPLAGIAFAGGSWLMFRKRQVLTPENVLTRMYANQLEGLEPYLDRERSDVDAAGFFGATYGIEGLWRRWRNARGWVFICEYAVMHGMAEDDDLVRMRNYAHRVGISSAVALLEATAGRISPNVVAAQGLSALQNYWRMSQEIYAISCCRGLTIGNASIAGYL